MLTLNSKLKFVRDALTAISTSVYHYYRPSNLSGCIIWQEDSEDGSFHANNHLAEQRIHGTIDYFTKKEFDEVIDKIQASLDAHNSHISWDLSSVQYEDDTKLIHYEWDFWVA